MSTVATPLANALDIIDAEAARFTDDAQRLIAAKCRGLVRGYDARWTGLPYKPLAVEGMVTSELYNPETQRRSRTFTLAGKLDVTVKYEGRRYIIDHKTTSEDITDPASPYWQQLAVEGQANHYLYLEWLNGRKADGAVWDVVRKPQIAPKTLSKAERARAVADRKYFNHPLSVESLDALQTVERETLEMYEARLTHDVVSERPERHFQRRLVARLDHEIAEWSGEVWQHGQNIIATRAATTETKLPVRNSGACLLYGSPCEYLGICSGHDRPDSGKWTRRERVHSELPDLEGDGRDVLTHSRIRCFQTCARRHYYRYELGIERIDAQEREALFFGSLLHLALNAWWTAQL